MGPVCRDIQEAQYFYFESLLLTCKDHSSFTHYLSNMLPSFFSTLIPSVSAITASILSSGSLLKVVLMGKLASFVLPITIFVSYASFSTSTSFHNGGGIAINFTVAVIHIQPVCVRGLFKIAVFVVYKNFLTRLQ